jgi:hypothetical protein
MVGTGGKVAEPWCWPTHLHLVPRLAVVVPSPPHTSSWRAT